MPLRRDALGGGSNADGSRSSTYCSHCYQGGAFTLPDLTAAGMQARVKEKLQSIGFPGFIAGLFTRRIPQLARWR